MTVWYDPNARKVGFLVGAPPRVGRLVEFLFLRFDLRATADMQSSMNEAGLFAKNLEFRDRDLTFLVHSYQDVDELTIMLPELRSIYGEARIVVCSDGDHDPKIAELAVAVDAEFHQGENLYAFHRAGAVCHRMLDLFLERPTRYFFKVDPDTGFHRRFNYVPAHSGMFGTIQSHEMFCSIQGGCLGMTLDHAASLHSNAVFLSPALADAAGTWASYPPMLRHCRKFGRVSSDWIFGYVATALGIPQFGFGEVMCRWRKPVDNRDLQYAITHPVPRRTPNDP